MKGFFTVLRLELRRLFRSGAAWLLFIACAAWMLALPHIVTSDGTAEGARTLQVQLSLGGVFAICCISLAASGASSLSKEREEGRLALSKVRPAARFALASGRMAALALVGAAALAGSALFLAVRTGTGRPCDHVIDPVMRSPAAEAAEMYEKYLALLPKIDEPDAPAELVEVLTAMTNAPKAAVIRLFTQKAVDRYETVSTNATASWRFPTPAYANGRPLSVRMKFSSDFNLREEVRGVFSFGAFSGAVSDITKSTVKVPLERGDAKTEEGRLFFTNTGANTLMLRPRKDIKLLVAADSFGFNLVRVWLQLSAILASICAFAVFLGSCLGRTVAVFACMVMLFVGTVSSDVIESYPDQLDAGRIDRISLAITRTTELAARPLCSLSPISSLAADECVEPVQTGMVLAVDGLAIPLAFALLSALAISRVRT